MAGGKMKYNAGILAAAIAEMQAGAREIGTNNSGVFVEKYLAPVGIKPPQNWCAAFVCWCAKQAGVQQGRYFISARQMYNFFKNQEWLVEQSELQAGDIIFYWRESVNSWKGHAGIVSAVSNNGKFSTIEGNLGNYPAPVRELRHTVIPVNILSFGRFYKNEE